MTFPHKDFDILQRQHYLQTRFIDAGCSVDDPHEIQCVGEFIDYIRAMQRNLNKEIDEILDELPTAATKSWVKGHNEACQQKLQLTGAIQVEAIDALCFMLNILLACGFENEDDVKRRYEAVFEKNVRRIEHGREENE